MCRPSCCNHTGGQDAGLAAVAILMLAALIVAKIGPLVAAIVHTTLEVIGFTALAIGAIAAVTAFTWLGIKVTRWQLHRRATIAASQAKVFVMPRRQQTGPAGQLGCLACGGTGTVLRAISAGRYRPGQCPVCEPAQKAG
jgi:hypothetical protein